MEGQQLPPPPPYAEATRSSSAETATTTTRAWQLDPWQHGAVVEQYRARDEDDDNAAADDDMFDRDSIVGAPILLARYVGTYFTGSQLPLAMGCWLAGLFDRNARTKNRRIPSAFGTSTVP